MSFSGEQLLVGLIALALLPFMALRIISGVRTGRLPLYRTYLERADGRGKFATLLALHVLSFLAVAIIAADLLLGLGLRERL